ncbi:MAG: cytochrome d ubiquinol oxidase subunit II [Chryseosolibacter sp.]
MLEVVILFFWLSVLLYFLLGGADFGAGIIEMFTSARSLRRTRATLYHAIGPIWEANHMWLIIAIVILFVGFPRIYSTLSIYLHIPLLLMLMGIIARGTAFVFRHYDAVKDSLQEVYNRIFVWSSFLTPLFLGIIAGTTVSGKIDVEANTFMEAFIDPWLNWFPIAVGFFTVALCGFLAAVYLVGEAGNENDRKRFMRKARNANIIAFALGFCVFMAAEHEGVPLTRWVFSDRVGLAAVVAATSSVVVLWATMNRVPVLMTRALVAFQVCMILLAITFEHYPDIVLLKTGNNLSLTSDHAPDKTIHALGWALLSGSLLILPALFYLYYSFHKRVSNTDHETLQQEKI